MLKFQIKAGEVTKLNIVMGQTGKIKISASEKESGKWVRAYHRINKIEDGEIGATVDSCTSYKKKECLMQIPVGKYVLESSYNEFKKETAFEIKVGEVRKLHVVFEQFRIETKCFDMSSEVTYEVYASSGRMVYDVQKTCSEIVQLTLDAGNYTVEASIGSDKKEEKFSIGAGESKVIMDMTTIKKEPSKEELIKADSPVEKLEIKKENKNLSKKIEQKHIDKADMKEAAEGLGQLGALLGQMGKAMGGDNVKDMNEAGAFLNALGGLIDPKKTEAIKKEIAQEKKVQKVENKKADKEFDDMSKELEMFTK